MQERFIWLWKMRAKVLWVCSMAHTSADAESEPEGRLCVWRSTVGHRTTRRVEVRTLGLPLGVCRSGREHDAQPSSVLPRLRDLSNGAANPCPQAGATGGFGATGSMEQMSLMDR